MKIGLIGLKWGSKYIRNIQDLGLNVDSCSSKNEETYLKLQNPPALWYPHWQDVVEQSDTVIITSPPSLHYEMTKFALERGKNVIVEKPFVFKVQEAEELYELSLVKGVKACVNYIHTFHEKYLNLKRRRFDLDRVSVYIENCGMGPVRSDYSPFWDWCHGVSWALDFRNATVFESSIIPLGKDPQKRNYNIVLSQYNGDALIYCGNNDEVKRNTFRIICGAKSVFHDDFKGNPLRVMLNKFFFSPDFNNFDLGLSSTRVMVKLENDLLTNPVV